MRRRLLTTSVTMALAVGLVATPAIADKPDKPDKPAGPLDTELDTAIGSYFDARALDHLWYGQIHEQYYAVAEGVQDYTGEFTSPGPVSQVVGTNDSALYTGNYLAGESFRFATAQAKLGRLYHLRDRRDGTAPGKSGDNPSGKVNGKTIPEDLDEQIAAWEAERDAAKAAVDTVAAQFHILTNISENWYGNPDLTLGGKSMTGDACDPQWAGDGRTDYSGEDECDASRQEEVVDDLATGEYQKGGYVDFGGGVITGGSTPVNAPQPGLLFRWCSPFDAPWGFNPAKQNPRDNRLARIPWDNDGDGVIATDADGNATEGQNCQGGTSRDAYAGVTFGLATALDFVADTDPELQAQIAHDIMVMTDYAVKYYWTAPRSHGRVVIPEVFGGNSLDNFYQPDMFFQVPLHRLNMIQIAKHAAYVAGTPEQQARYEAIWAEELATQLPVLAFSMEVDAAEAHGGYYKFHLHHMTGFNLIRLESDPTLRAQFMQAFGVMDLQTRSHVNAFYEAITYGLTGEQDRLDDAVLHHRQWLDYFRNNQVSQYVTRNSARCDKPAEEGGIACVPDYARPLQVGGEDTGIDTGVYNEVPGTVESAVTGSTSTPKMRAKDPLPVAWRRSGDFMWQKDPTILDGGGNPNPRYSVAGADYLVVNWLLRYYTEIDEPAAVTPFGTPDIPVIR